ncbi:MAG TPA: type II toxin-antitoxin system Phd/YefM family antitoxin [Thermoanaerobaculia bacterium]
MKTLELADVSRLPEELKSGETIELIDDGKVVAQVVPAHVQTFDERMNELVREGRVRKGTGTLPPDFLTRILPKAEASVLEQLLEDRRTGR